MKLTIIFNSRTKQNFRKAVSERRFKIKTILSWTVFRNFAYASSYLQTNIFAHKWDCAIALTLQIPRHYSRPF